MKRTRVTHQTAFIGLILSVATAHSSVTFTTKPVVTRKGTGATISFSVSEETDVEVAILDKNGKVVRHLAAGALRPSTASGNSGQVPPPPPAPLKPGLAQALTWNGKNDFGETAQEGPFSTRVRLGMGVKLEAIAGGDPYAYHSKVMGQGDHAAWRITGMDVKPDGTVYILGNANNYGPPALRAYNADGSYLRTVYPPPAGLTSEQARGWGISKKADGSYTFLYADRASPALSKTGIAATRGACASLIPSPDNATVMVSPLANKLTRQNALLPIGTDGTLRNNKRIPLFAGAPADNGVFGPLSCAYTQDRKTMYVTGLFSCKHRYGAMIQGVHTNGFWRDGQVWKVDVATRKATVFFALDKGTVISSMRARAASPIAHASKYWQFAAFHGIAVDADGNVLIGDRQNSRIVVLDRSGKVIREIPIKHVDALALDPASKSLYVATRLAGKKGSVKLLKFNDWTRDDKPVTTLQVCSSYMYSPRSYLGVTRSGNESLVWLAYTTLPIRIYRDKGNTLELVKDFYNAASQRALDLQHFVVDPQNERIYVCDGFNRCFVLDDWEKPIFKRLVNNAGRGIGALSMSIDARGRYLYCHQDRRPVVRYRIEGDSLTPDIPGGAKVPQPKTKKGKGRPFVGGLTPRISNDWRIGLGMGDRGIAAAPDGSVVTMSALGTGANYGGYLRFYRADDKKIPWGEGLLFKSFGTKLRNAAGARFDPAGNLYAGKMKGSIYKYTPTGQMGDLFPTEPKAPSKVYKVDYGFPSPGFTRTARFGVDGFGRIYYPTSLASKVSVMDNEGNPVLSFGTYGNRDSMGGLQGDLVPTKDIPMAWPNTVDVTDDYIYVSDIVNIRLLRIRKTFAATKTLRMD